jgi:hypothetical protein
MTIYLSIETDDKNLVYDILGKRSARSGDKVSVVKDIELEYRGTLIRLAEGFPDIIRLVLIAGGTIGINIFSQWLYDKIKGRASKLKIDTTVVEIDKGEITRILRQKIKKE